MSIDHKDMALALRWTGEINRQLCFGTRAPADDLESRLLSAASHPEGDFRGGGEAATLSALVDSFYRIRSGEQLKEDLTLFHAKSPRPSLSNRRRGAARWGPDMATYLDHLVAWLDIRSDMELMLSMIYLDRACSVETPRSNGIAPCPYVSPRTMHRLTLTSLLLAVQAVRGVTLEELLPKIKSLGIPDDQLEQMVSWMRGALGDPGPFVTPQQLMEWTNTWLRRFPHSQSTSDSSSDDVRDHGSPMTMYVTSQQDVRGPPVALSIENNNSYPDNVPHHVRQPMGLYAQ